MTPTPATCARCETRLAVATFRARLRRTTGRGHVHSLPTPMCGGCAETVHRLLAPGGVLVAAS